MRKNTSRSQRPALGSQQFSLALAALNAGDFSKAETLSKALAIAAPKNADACHLWAVACYQLCKLAEAEELFGRTLKLKQDPSFYLNLALTQRALHKIDAAIASFRQTLLLAPKNAQASNNLANILTARRQHEEAEALYRDAILHNPAYAVAFQNLGILLRETYRTDEAEVMLRKAIALAPTAFESRVALGNLLENKKRYAKASEIYRGIGDWGQLQRVSRKQAVWENLAQYDAATLQALQNKALETEPWSLLNIPTLSAITHRQAGRQFAERKWAQALQTPALVINNAPDDRVLKIGYLSSDFYEHATMHLLAGVLEEHDPQQVEIHLYSYGPPRDDIFTRRIARAGVQLHDIRQLSDEAAASEIAAAGLHMLVDLKGYTTGARLGICALRPAPVVVSWLGYPGSLGQSRLADYIIGDPVVTPAQHADDFSETLALMPHCYQPNDRHRHIAPRPDRVSAGLPEQGLVFCSFNQILKINPADFSLWCRLLQTTPDSVLWLLSPESAQTEDNLRRHAQVHGIAPQRLIFAPRLPLEQHLGRLQLADLALDTFPCNSHTTASDALWAGVPLITKMGKLFAGRVAASLLNAHGFPELIAADDENYVELALSLACAPERRAALRQRLANARLSSPLFDTPRFTRDLERLYRAIWNRHSDRPDDKSAIVLAPCPEQP
ncbi:MAG: tetratricopeptide repeat protein [Collimonas sp.]|uniref:O-linked N-acetylglucosamine transferase, SPINDLY family protein n=1 Tax=Collimonas sp. TaxID=1963772 RepID=UPI003264F628